MTYWPCGCVWSDNMQGACTTLLSVRVYYIACPSVLVNYANFTETPAGPKMTSIVQRSGSCVPHADVADQRPSYLCKADGSWYYATGSCRCRPGYQPNEDSSTQCTGMDRVPTVLCIRLYIIHLHSSKSTAKKNKQTNERTNKHIYICASLFTKTW